LNLKIIKDSNNQIRDKENFNLFLSNNNNKTEINLHAINEFSEKTRKDKKSNLLSLFKKDKANNKTFQKNLVFKILKNENESNKKEEKEGEEKSIIKNNKMLIDKIFTHINSQTENSIGINSIDMEKYEEKLLNHYAGLAHKIEINEGKSQQTTKDNYLESDWYYALVYPNPDWDKKEKYCKMEQTRDLYDKFFFPDTSKTSFLKGGSSEKNVFDFVIRNKINDNINNNCLINNGGCFRKSIYLINFFNYFSYFSKKYF
jgi:hypothetical protein